MPKHSLPSGAKLFDLFLVASAIVIMMALYVS